MVMRSSQSGFTLVEMVVITAVFTILAGMGMPLFNDISDSIKLGEAGRQVERELQTARLTAVSANQPIRVRFNCNSTGEYRMVELIGTPSVPAAADSATNRCSTTLYPFPASDRNPLTKPFTEQAQLAAHALGVEVEAVTVKGVEEFRNAFEQMQRRRIEAVIVQPSLPHRPAAELALEVRLPTISITRAYAEAGGLMSYAASLMERYRGAASYVDKILKGSKPAELPVGQPTKFELVVNMTTAKALGLKVPSTLIDRADDLIE